MLSYLWIVDKECGEGWKSGTEIFGIGAGSPPKLVTFQSHQRSILGFFSIDDLPKRVLGKPEDQS